MRVKKKPVEVDAVQYVGPDYLPEGVCICEEVEVHGPHIHTLEGTMLVRSGDWIIRGIKGEFYPCKPDIFDKSYDVVRGEPAVIFYDTETNGLPKNFKAPPARDDNWPKMVQMAWVVCDRYGNTIAEHSYIIKPEGFTISDESAKIHRITQVRAEAMGIALSTVITAFAHDFKMCSDVLAHNIQFDNSVLNSEEIRLDYFPRNDGKSRYYQCTMLGSVDVCKIPSARGYKWPKLSELHQFLFNKSFEEAHDALVDVKALVRCFWEMKRRFPGKFPLQAEKELVS